MSAVIKPTIGRRVWYWPTKADAEVMNVLSKHQPLDAGVVYVWNDAMVNLDVTDHNGYHHNKTSVALLQGDANAEGGGYCQWMPYQVGQAKKDALVLPVIEQAADSAIEKAIVAAGATTAPRVTPADLQANIVDTEIVKHVSKGGQVLRWAILTTRSGYAVVGRPSVSVSPANDRADIGERVAIENSTNELWPLMGYALKEQLHTEPDMFGMGN